MSITHEQAQKLIQFRFDGALPSAEKTVLAAHLRDCLECQKYANELNEVENILVPVLKRQWNVQPAPLAIDDFIGSKRKTPSSALLTMRKVAITFVFFALFFSVWQFMSTGPSDSGYVQLVVPSVPTPGAQTAQSISTKSTVENCEMKLYTVQENDTLASISNRFLVSEHEIIAINQFRTKAVSASMELMIPVCHFTPTGTIHPATFTSTYTPTFRSITLTPGG